MQTSSAVGLGAVPPSSDPQRLLSYVLNIMPQYTSMELSTTHFRLYNQHLRLELEQVRQTLEFMQERAHDEEDKRLFLEKYASEVVKERNELLHHKGKKSHKLWHNCCRKHASYDLDVTPSIASLRGEKLTEVGLQLKQNMQALQEKDRLLQTAQHLAHTKQIELDAHMSSCRKERDQLHDYIAQISGLQTAQERQLYEAQSQLAVEVEANDKSHGEIDQLHRRLEQVEGQLEEQSAVLADKDSQIQHLTHLLENAADVERQLQDECRRLAHPGRHAEIEALHSQVEALQTADMTQLTRKYTKHIQMLQDQLDKQSRTIDGLEQELHRFRPMTLDDMSDKDTPPSVAASSWHDSLGSVSQYSRVSLFEASHPLPPSLVSQGRSRSRSSSSSSSSSSCSSRRGRGRTSSTSSKPHAGSDIDRDGILHQLQLLVHESTHRRQVEEAQARMDQDYLGLVRRRVDAYASH